MPRVNIYIREEDWPKWQAIDDKPKWLHNALNDIIGVVATGEVSAAKVLSGEPTVAPPEDVA